MPPSLLTIPTEIRYQIYTYLLPTNLEIHIRPSNSTHIHLHTGLSIHWCERWKNYNDENVKNKGKYSVEPCLKGGLAVEMALFRICKVVTQEVYDTFYGGNIFVFEMGCLEKRRAATADGEVFGSVFGDVFGGRGRGSGSGVAGKMKRCCIIVRMVQRGALINKDTVQAGKDGSVAYDRDHHDGSSDANVDRAIVKPSSVGSWDPRENRREYLKLHTWMAQFSSAVRGGQLQELRIKCFKGRFAPNMNTSVYRTTDFVPAPPMTPAKRGMLNGEEDGRVWRSCFLEPLSQLRGLSCVEFEGVEEGFGGKLGAVMQGGEEMELEMVQYGVRRIAVNGKRKRGEMKEATRSVKKWYDPVYDWVGIGERHCAVEQS
ncbi:hypothetical protein EJ08DRAFT_648352 [Tothia fuscella]|uniref:Uncharacterized protein n=1 Tax=Tothia fuscella TaxID=1048955 RepID=A0A9P4NVC3_9PEZI|nr:hypothetical protein EJ08DRAFT_648352 [Tothia fuscella]